MSGTCTGVRVTAVRPIAPSPFAIRMLRRAAARAPPVSAAARWTNSSTASSYSKTTPPSSPESSTARETMVVSTVARSRVEPTARPTSPSAVSCSTDRVRSAVRASSALNRRTFSIAITAWSAKVCSSPICLSVNGPASPRRSCSAPIAAPSRMRGTATDAWKPSSRAWCQVRGNSAATAAMSGTWTTRCSSTLRAVMVSRAIGRTRPVGEARGP